MSLRANSSKQILLMLITTVMSMISLYGVEKRARFHFKKTLMGTEFQIICYSHCKETAQKAASQAFERAERIEAICSDYKPDSEVRKLQGGKMQKLSPTLYEVLTKALTIAKNTDGAFDPTIGHHTYNWRRAKARGKLPSEDSIQQAKKHTGWKRLVLFKDNGFITDIKSLKIDFGGIAKGYAADKMLETLAKHDISHAMIAAGGDIRLGDAPPNSKGWKVGIKNLQTITDKNTTYLILSNCAISTSGDIHQFVEINGARYSHIVDPQTGHGLTKRISATVIAPTATESDPFATAACISKPFSEKLLTSQGDIKLLLVTKLGDKTQSKQSANFPNTLTK